MDVAAFDFDLPRERIAARPAAPRDAARLLEARDDALDDRHMRDLPALLRPGDLLVFNDTRVIRARLKGRRGTAAVEVTLHKRVDAANWDAFARPARKLKPGDRIDFAADLAAQVTARGEGGETRLRFSREGAALDACIAKVGMVPLPPYIPRPRGPDAADADDYQTIFACRDGAVAAPTAGLHFTDRLLAALDARGVATTRLTLHVGAGTFLPVKVADTRDHRMHAEWGEITGDAAAAVTAARDRGGRVVACGTTALRLIESASDARGHIAPFAGETALFITPGYRFKVVDLLLTNFHLPRSTLFMLVCAFSGLARMRRAYDHAIKAGYRFYSYGDACLLHRDAQ